MATHSSILGWKIPWTEKPGRLQSMGSQESDPVTHLVTKLPPRMGKTRDLLKKIRDYKGRFQAKMGSTKDRNGMDLTEAEDTKKGWQEHTEELYKKDLYDPDNHDGLITHLEPDTLECKAKWALGSITMNKVSGGDRISVELFQILKDDAVKVLHSICQQIWKTQQWPQDWKSQFSFHSQRKEMPKNVQTTAQLHSSHTLAK